MLDKLVNPLSSLPREDLERVLPSYIKIGSSSPEPEESEAVDNLAPLLTTPSRLTATN
jgi:hypothetical protein